MASGTSLAIRRISIVLPAEENIDAYRMQYGKISMKFDLVISCVYCFSNFDHSKSVWPLSKKIEIFSFNLLHSNMFVTLFTYNF